MGKIIESMNNHFCEQLVPGEVAEIVNMSVASFCRFMKKHNGLSFIDELNKVRLGQVSRLLIDSSQSISEMAFNFGFNNMANFSRPFKSKKGMTPKEFRNIW